MKKILIAKRLENSTRYTIYKDDSLLKANEEYEIASEEFLSDLFSSFDDYGIMIDTWLKEGSTFFGGNCSSARLVPYANQIYFWDCIGKKDVTHTMDFDEFLRLNDEFHYLIFKKADFIIFRREGNKVTIEGIWNKEN